MCIAFWLWQPTPLPAAGDGPSPVRYALLLALNRDEVLSRPTQAAHFWADDPGIFAGRDLVQGGTWLGVSKSGRIGWLTNVRETYVDAAAHTRGDLVTAFLQVSIASDHEPQRIEHSQRVLPPHGLFTSPFGHCWKMDN